MKWKNDRSDFGGFQIKRLKPTRSSRLRTCRSGLLLSGVWPDSIFLLYILLTLSAINPMKRPKKSPFSYVSVLSGCWRRGLRPLPPLLPRLLCLSLTVQKQLKTPASHKQHLLLLLLPPGWLFLSTPERSVHLRRATNGVRGGGAAPVGLGVGPLSVWVRVRRRRRDGGKFTTA